MTTTNSMLLASASMRRRRLLAGLGIPFEVVVPDVEEIEDPAIPPSVSAKENALLKNRWAMERYPGRSILTADTVIDFHGHCIGKPVDLAEACAFLRKFSGHHHKVITAVAYSAPDRPLFCELTVSDVIFRKLTDEQIDSYFLAVDPLDKAGAYDIDQHGDWIIERYSGSLTNIIGLPMETVTRILSLPGPES